MDEFQKLAFEESVLIEDRKIGDYIDFLKEKSNRVLVGFYVGTKETEIVPVSSLMSVDATLLEKANEGILTLNLSHSACEDLYINNGFVSGTLRSNGRKVEFNIPRGCVVFVRTEEFTMYQSGTLSTDIIEYQEPPKQPDQPDQPTKTTPNVVNLFGGKK